MIHILAFKKITVFLKVAPVMLRKFTFNNQLFVFFVTLKFKILINHTLTIQVYSLKFCRNYLGKI